MLRAPLEPTTSEAFARELGRDPQLLTRYRSSLRLWQRLSNGFAHESLAGAPTLAVAGKSPVLRELSLFPPVRSYETDLVEKLFKDDPVPPDFDLADEMGCRIGSGQLQLQPRADSG